MDEKLKRTKTSEDEFLARINKIYLPVINPLISEKCFLNIQEKVQKILREYRRALRCNGAE